MENAVIEVPLKQVGNSLCLFIPADVKNDLELKQSERVVVTISKKKNKNALLALSGATRGKLGPFIEKEDRADARE